MHLNIATSTLLLAGLVMCVVALASGTNVVRSVVKRQAPVFGTSIFFKYRWVTQCGSSATFPSNDVSIQVSSTLSVADVILEKAARLVYHMTRFMPRTLFRALSQNVSVGVFLYRQDQPSTFPEYTDRTERPGCAGRCDSECSLTCIDDGTKFDDQWYYSGPRVLVAGQNLNCDRNFFDDPQFGLLNLLVSEMARASEQLLSPRTTEMLYRSYQAALDGGLWVSSTATSSASNYFTQGSLAWFTATRLTESETGRMNLCGEQACTTEDQARKRIQDADPRLYKILNDVYNNGRDYIQGGITVCRW